MVTRMVAIHVQVDLENTLDAGNAVAGLIKPEAVRRYALRALVDTGAVMIVLPQEAVEYLGLGRHGKTIATFADDRRGEWEVAGPLTLRFGNRQGIFDCLVGPPASEALLGHIPLERLDLIVDPIKQTLTVRPESPLLPMLSVK